MLLCSAVRIDLKSGGCLWPPHILPLGYSKAGVVCTTLGFINEIDRCVKLLCSPLRGRKGAHETTAGVFVHTHARSFRMDSGVGELTRPHKGTLFNLLHIKAQAPQSEQALTAVGTSQSLPL